MTHRFFLKLWLEMRLGGTVSTRRKTSIEPMKNPDSPKAKKARQVRSNVKINFVSSFMLTEMCPRDFFILNKRSINKLIWLCWKITRYCRNKDQKFGAAMICSFNTTMPLPTGPRLCSSFGQKTTWMLSLILPIHLTLCHATFSCSLVWKATWRRKILLMSAKWKRKRWRSWKHQHCRAPEML